MTNNIYGVELQEHINSRIANIKESMNNRNSRIADGMTDIDDCFVSIRSDERQIHEYEMQLNILKGSGTMPIDCYFDENGNEVNVRWVQTRYGSKLVGNGIFANSKKALVKKTGWTVEERQVPCWTSFVSGSGGGMCSVYTGSIAVVRWHTNMVTGENVGYPN